VAMLN